MGLHSWQKAFVFKRFGTPGSLPGVPNRLLLFAPLAVMVSPVGGMVEFILGVEHPVFRVEPAVGAHGRRAVVCLLMVRAVGGVLPDIRTMQSLVGTVAGRILSRCRAGKHQGGEGRKCKCFHCVSFRIAWQGMRVLRTWMRAPQNAPV